MGVLGNKPGSSARVVSALNCQATSLGPTPIYPTANLLLMGLPIRNEHLDL